MSGYIVIVIVSTRSQPSGVIIIPTQTMHYFFREIPQKYHIFALFDPPFIWVFPKIGVFAPQIIHFNFGFSIIFTLHFEGNTTPIFGLTPILVI